MKQRPPLREWRTWLLLGGRGAGKTRTGAEWLKGVALADPHYPGSSGGRVALVGTNYDDIRDVMIEGESGLLAISHKSERPQWLVSKRELIWPNGTIGKLFSSADPESLRGSQFGAVWLDVFVDPKSAQSATPYFSSGNRDDLVQRRFLEAHYEYWSEVENNPVSALYNGPMLEVAQITPWAWDSRPFPWFPIDTNSWNDGENWHVGHWLTGRLGGVSVNDLIARILQDYGVIDFEVKVDAILDGYVSPGSISAREVLEPLIALFGINVSEQEGRLIFADNSNAPRHTISIADLVQDVDQPSRVLRRSSETELPIEAIFHHTSVFSEYEEAASKSNRIEGDGKRQVSIQAPVTVSGSMGRAMADAYLKRQWKGRDEMQLRIPRKHLEVCSGDIINFSDDLQSLWLVKRNEIGHDHSLTLQSVEDYHAALSSGDVETGKVSMPLSLGKPTVNLMDLPTLSGNNNSDLVTHLSIFAEPWGKDYNVFTSPSDENYSLRKTISQKNTIGKLRAPIGGSFSGRWDYMNQLQIDLRFGSLETLDALYVLGGANLLAVKSSLGTYEVLQFRRAELMPDGFWILSELLRGQLGTEPEALSGAETGASVILLDGSVAAIPMDPSERGIEFNWRIGPVDLPDSSEAHVQLGFANHGRAKKMFSPVHLNGQRQSGGDIQITWIRRGRIDADNWENADIPLDAANQKYNVKILDSASAIKRELIVELPSYVYRSADQIEDFGNDTTDFTCLVAQLGDNGLPGTPAEFQHTNI